MFGLSLEFERLKMKESLQQLKWWQKGIIYQVYLKSFKDTNGDGIGDLRGVLDKIDYFKLIGVDIIYLTPFYPNGGLDNGYDLISYYDIDPTYGTMADFDELIKRLHDNGMYLIIDFIPNHTSNQHEWFQKSCNNDSPDNPYRDYYVWYPSVDPINPPNNWVPIIGKSAWTYHEKRKSWYYHTFLPEQPDLNMRCPRVQEEMKNILKFWLLTKNVDGIRIDAIKHLFEDASFKDEPKSTELYSADPTHVFETLDHIYTLNQPETYQILTEWREYMDEMEHQTNRPRLLFIESYGTPEQICKYLEWDNRPAATFPLNFQLLNLFENEKSPLSNVRVITKFRPDKLKNLIDEWNKFDEIKYFWSNWELGNHDCARIATRIGRENAKLANALCLLLGGTPFTYYGEEIGMEDLDYDSISFEECQDSFGKTFGPENYKKYNRDYCRSPMQWDDSANAGFTDSNSKPWLKLHSNHKNINVELEIEDPKSVLNSYRELVKLRQQPSFLCGSFKYAIVNENIFSFIRCLKECSTFLVVMNLSNNNVSVSFQSTNLVPPVAHVVYYFDNNTRKSNNESFILKQNIITSNINLVQKSCLILTW